MFFRCGYDNSAVLLPGEAGATGGAKGDGRRNTEVLSQTPECTGNAPGGACAPNKTTYECRALTLVNSYRGGGLDDWYLPSVDELIELRNYPGRNAIGGFLADFYMSSTTNPFEKNGRQHTDFRMLNFRNDNQATGSLVCSILSNLNCYYDKAAVRPIRAFS